ncbi:MAG: hypothetical protein WAM82_32775 [Thermoanaerobaculia bacterium]
MGAKASYQESFNDGTSWSLADGFSVGDTKLFTVGLGADFSATHTYGGSFSITKSDTRTITLPGNGDGINHEQDEIYILLNPVVSIGVLGVTAQWNIGYKGASPIEYPLTVAELRHPELLAPNVARLFKDLTPDDYASILAQDPFADHPTGGIDPKRYKDLHQSIPYKPPLPQDCNDGTCTCLSYSDVVKIDKQSETSTGYQTTYKTSLSIDANLGAALFKSTDTSTVTLQSSTSDTNGSTVSASLAISCPSVAYTKPEDSALLEVYWDTVYQTFMFAPADTAPELMLHQGHLTDTSGKPLALRTVRLAVDGVIYSTLTDRYGEYRFFAALPNHPESGTLSVAGIKRAVKLDASPLDLHLQ